MQTCENPCCCLQ